MGGQLARFGRLTRTGAIGSGMPWCTWRFSSCDQHASSELDPCTQAIVSHTSVCPGRVSPTALYPNKSAARKKGNEKKSIASSEIIISTFILSFLLDSSVRRGSAHPPVVVNILRHRDSALAPDESRVHSVHGLVYDYDVFSRPRDVPRLGLSGRVYYSLCEYVDEGLPQVAPGYQA